jgi:hypothetical protein
VWGRAGLCEERAWHLLLHDLISSRAGSLLRHPGRPHAFLHVFLLEIRTRPREKSCFGGNQRTTTLFSLGNTHPSERKVVFRWKPPDDDTVFSRLGNTHPSERKVVFRWKPTDDDTVFSRLGNTHPSERKVVFRWKLTDDDTVFSRLGNTRPLREKSGVPLNPRGSFFRRLRHFELCSSTQQPQSAFRGNHLTFPTLLCAFSLSAPPPVPTRTP